MISKSGPKAQMAAIGTEVKKRLDFIELKYKLNLGYTTLI
jgi:hypothetical protein